MVLVLFYIEDMKRFIVESIRATDRLRRSDRLGNGKKVMQTAFAILVEEQILTEAESIEIQNLIDYRNTVAHETQNLTNDVGSFADQNSPAFKTAYDRTALRRITAYREKISNGMRGFVLSLGLRPLEFEAAERTYLTEISRLRKRIKKGIDLLSREIDTTNAAIKKIPTALINEIMPGHPQNQKNNGTLSIKGVNCCYKLFDNGATPLAVAHLMRISLRAARAWKRKWDIHMERE